MAHRFGIRIGDICLTVLLLLLAGLLFFLPFLRQAGVTAEIVIAETGESRNISLEQDGTYAVTGRGIHLTVAVKDGAVCVLESDCRDHICRNTPPISRAGQSIVCAPAGVVVRITGEGAAVDGVSG